MSERCALPVKIPALTYYDDSCASSSRFAGHERRAH